MKKNLPQLPDEEDRWQPRNVDVPSRWLFKDYDPQGSSRSLFEFLLFADAVDWHEPEDVRQPVSRRRLVPNAVRSRLTRFHALYVSWQTLPQPARSPSPTQEKMIALLRSFNKALRQTVIGSITGNETDRELLRWLTLSTMYGRKTGRKASTSKNFTRHAPSSKVSRRRRF